MSGQKYEEHCKLGNYYLMYIVTLIFLVAEGAFEFYFLFYTHITLLYSYNRFAFISWNTAILCLLYFMYEAVYLFIYCLESL